MINGPSPPFDTPYKITMSINFSNLMDDWRRIEGEFWCCENTRHKWFRRALAHLGVVEFHFEVT